MRIKYPPEGGTALPTDSDTFVLMDSRGFAGYTAGGEPIASMDLGQRGFKKLRVAFRNDQAGTVTLDKWEAGAWVQVAEAAVAASADTDINEFEFMIHQYEAIRLEWENGSVTQTTFAADMVLDDEVGAPT